MKVKFSFPCLIIKNLFYPKIKFGVLTFFLSFVVFLACSDKKIAEFRELPSFEEAVGSKRDIWGEAAINEPDGPSYEFFIPLLSPPRYVNADFRDYPIVLSAPGSSVKARLISNGSSINLKGGARSWNDTGLPVSFRVGPDEFLFGSLKDRLSEPVLDEGWLPIVKICYQHRTPVKSEGEVPLDQKKQSSETETYRLEAFAATDTTLASKGVVFVKFDLTKGNNGYIAADFEDCGEIRFINGRIIDKDDRIIALFDKQWSQDNKLMKARLKQGITATLAIPSQPLAMDESFNMSSHRYSEQREKCISTWKNIIGQGMRIQLPEKLVNNVYRNSLCQIFQMINGNEIHYSAGNQYQKLYEAEGSDAAQALMICGYENEMHRLMEPLFKFTRKGLELHQASIKINNLCRYFYQTRNLDVIEEFKDLWRKEIHILDTCRTGLNGLYPPEQYCGDIHTFVQSLNVNSNGWRAMRDMGALLSEIGYSKEGNYYTEEARAFRRTVLDAIKRSASYETYPPFIPISLSGGEPVHNPILHSRIGSYWNITIGYTIRSGIFHSGSEEENWIPHYQEKYGGLLMGMVRSGGGEFNFWTGEQRVNPLYGTRYALDALRRDDPERALVSFYGMLAQGITRNTFIGGEGSALHPVDEYGRFFYCPPNSAASAHVLSMLRNLLVQDWDLDDDGIPETLRLAYATSQRWLADGNEIVVEDSPTAFGLISYSVKSFLKEDKVVIVYKPPARAPLKTFFRIRLPENWEIVNAYEGMNELKIDKLGTLDISELRDTTRIIVYVRNTNF